MIKLGNMMKTNDSNDNNSLGAVIYTDGSCRPTNPGFIGWGAHGYLYINKEIKKPIVVRGNVVTSAGYMTSYVNSYTNAICVEPTHYLDMFGSSLETGTNNQAEIQAVYNALLFLKEAKVNDISVFTDSEYTKNGINDWCKKWEKNNWIKSDGTVVLNAELWKKLYSLVKELLSIGTKIRVDWVKAHDNVFGNVIADELSVIAMLYSSAGEYKVEYNKSPSKGYWNSDADKHPFINYKRLYFNSVERYNSPGMYFQADPGGPEVPIGKRTSEAAFSVIMLNEPCEVIEKIKEAQYIISNDYNNVIMIKLDRVFSKDLYKILSKHGRFCLLKDKNNFNLNYVDKNPVTVEINPTGLSLNAIEILNTLEGLLHDFRSTDSTNVVNANYSYVDITDRFFEKSIKEVKKVTKTVYNLKNDITNNLKSITVPICNKDKTFNVQLVFGLDILPRNNLKKLEDLEPSVYVVCWNETGKTVRYATIIKTNDGIGIWSNFFSDKLFI
jgi:ribonuclease HI